MSDCSKAYDDGFLYGRLVGAADYKAALIAACEEWCNEKHSSIDHDQIYWVEELVEFIKTFEGQ